MLKFSLFWFNVTANLIQGLNTNLRADLSEFMQKVWWNPKKEEKVQKNYYGKVKLILKATFLADVSEIGIFQTTIMYNKVYKIYRSLVSAYHFSHHQTY